MIGRARITSGRAVGAVVRGKVGYSFGAGSRISGMWPGKQVRVLSP